MRCRATGKVRHFSRHAAIKAKAKVFSDRGVVLHEYFCTDCTGWHLGGTPATRTASMDRAFDTMHEREDALKRLSRANDSESN